MTTKRQPKAPARKPSAPSKKDDGEVLNLPRIDGASEARMLADFATRGEVLNALNAARYLKSGDYGAVDISEMAASLRATGAEVVGGDLSNAERMLHSQAVSLNVIFCELARRSHANMGTYLETAERYMRLALKAQGQCRATLETLAAIKNPPIVYARQMNVANGPQQVNNGAVQNNEKQAQPFARTPETQTPPNELLEDSAHGSPQLDTRATTQAGRGHPELVPVEAINGAAHR